MLSKTSRKTLPLVKLVLTCIIGLVLSAIASHTHAQGANVDLSLPDDRVSETGNELQNTVKGITRLYFAFGAETLESDSQSALRSLAKLAEANPDGSFVIMAHTDNRGWALGNLELSRIRARSVAKGLIANGIDIARLKAYAFGESRPVAPNNTAEGRRLNRRVEVSLTP